MCEDKGNKKETCFGNWIDKDDYGKDRNLHLKKQTVTCNEIPCPGTWDLRYAYNDLIT